MGSLQRYSSGQPLITHIYTADPSAHVFDGKLYIYSSHDRETNIENSVNGERYDMNDYHVFSLETIDGAVTDHGVSLSIEDIPWAAKQLWAPDAVSKNGMFYLFFPARDHDGIFRIGVAISATAQGPFTAEPNPIPGSYSIDPASFVDDDGQVYLFFGGLQGGQLHHWATREFNPQVSPSDATDNGVALQPRVARLTDDLKSFSSPILGLIILDSNGRPLRADDHDRRFFEAAWMHKYNGVYYFSYSTGNTHFIVYATGDSPIGPFTYRGRILEPVIGWTTHHSIVEFKGKWYLFYHDSTLSNGKSHLRCIKVQEIFYDSEGNIKLHP